MALKKAIRIFYSSPHGNGKPFGYLEAEEFGTDAFIITYYQYQRARQKLKRLTGSQAIKFYTGRDIYVLEKGNVCGVTIKRGVINE